MQLPKWITLTTVARIKITLYNYYLGEARELWGAN